MISYAEWVRTSRAQLLATAIDTGTGASAKLTIYTGTKPAPGAAPTDQLALVALTFSHPCAKTISGGVLTLKPLAEQMATASGADLELPAAEFFAGALIRINTATITEP